MKILITGGKSVEAVKLLKAFESEDVIISDYGDVPAFFANKYEFVSLGERNEETLAHTLLSSCLDHQADVVLPLHIFEIEPIIRAKTLFHEFDIDVLLPDLAELNQYRPQTLVNKSNWGIFLQGKVFYTNKDSVAITLAAKKENLHGAYYFETNGDSVQFSLIAI